ncbi:MAG: lysylphosphatidylglycerol synthase transmembrane domain-containing protein [Candidatus Delongbacteria bacterium]
MKKNLSKYLKIAFSVVLLFYLFYYMIDLKSLVIELKRAKPAFVILAFIFLVLSVFASSYRWQYVINIKNTHISFKACVREYFIGSFFNNFLPGSIGGDIMRMAGAYKETGSKEISFSSVIIERVVGLAAMLFVGLTGFIILNIGNSPSYIQISSIMLIMLFLLLFIITNKKTNKILSEFTETYIPEKISSVIISYLRDFAGYSSTLKIFIVFLLSLIFKILDGFFVYFVFLSLGIELSYAHAIALFSIINVIKMLPISFNGLGLSAISWVLLLRSFGISESAAASVDFLVISISLLMSTYGGLLYFVKTGKEKGL